MLTALDADENQFDDAERKFVDNIRECGWFNNHILAGEEGPAYNFTTGFQVTLGLPEIIVFGLPDGVAHNVLWDIYRQLEAGKRYETGRPYSDFLEDCDVYFQTVAKAQYYEHLGWSRWFYGGDHFDCWQLVWPDKQGAFPWEPQFSVNFADIQPDLSVGSWGGKFIAN